MGKLADDPMSHQTYVGPFGRILPLPDGSKAEQACGLLADEERAGLHLPRPPLNFGSDPSIGFTDPTRYNTSTHSRKTQEQRFLANDDRRPSLRDTLPPVRQLLTPASHPSAPSSPYSSQHSAVSSQRRSSLTSSRHGSVPEQGSDHLGFPQHPPDPEVMPGMQTQTVPSNSRIQPLPHYQDSFQTYNMSQQARLRYSHQENIPLTDSGQSLILLAQSPGPPPPPLTRPRYPAYEVLDEKPISAHAPVWKDPSGVRTSGQEAVVSPTPSRHAPTTAVKPGPRVVREDVLPNEGPVWVYQDGSVCPKVIDGEQVNAEWGITKAGKPRKRLAIACTSCREKKIKCDPAEPRCVQCEKNNRVCKFATA